MPWERPTLWDERTPSSVSSGAMKASNRSNNTPSLVPSCSRNPGLTRELNTSGRPLPLAAVRLICSTTAATLATLSVNGQLMRSNSTPSNWVSSVCPRVSAVMPVRSETKKTRRLMRSGLALAATGTRLQLFRQEQPGFHHRVRVERDTADLLLQQPQRQVRMIGRPLAADADVFSLLAAGLDGHVQQCLDRGVAFVEQPGHQAGVAVETESQLGKIVGADRETVEMLEEVFGQQRI